MAQFCLRSGSQAEVIECKEAQGGAWNWSNKVQCYKSSFAESDEREVCMVTYALCTWQQPVPIVPDFTRD